MLTWDEINARAPIVFEETLVQEFHAVFFDQEGEKAEASLGLTLHCGGHRACDGVCTPSDRLNCGGCSQLCVGTCFEDTCSPASLYLGPSNSCVSFGDGALHCWGSNEYAQLGSEFGEDQETPLLMEDIEDFEQVAIGDSYFVVLLRNGSVLSWGRNDRGQLGIGSTVDQDSPQAIEGLSGVQQIAAGRQHTCALMKDKTVRCWGTNSNGELGLGDSQGRNTPQALSSLSDVQQLAAGESHSCALLGGEVSCWGRNDSGQVSGPTGSILSPRSVEGLSGVKQLFASQTHSCAVLDDGSVKCWGSNGVGQLGLGEGAGTGVRRSPVTVPGLSGVRQMALGGSFSCALLEDGTVQCWGKNSSGQLGLGFFHNDQFSPQPVPGLSEVWQIAAGSAHSCALLEDLTVKCWGYNAQGQLGIGSQENAATPQTVVFPEP